MPVPGMCPRAVFLMFVNVLPKHAKHLPDYMSHIPEGGILVQFLDSLSYQETIIDVITDTLPLMTSISNSNLNYRD
jgi:hypothetical protein